MWGGRETSVLWEEVQRACGDGFWAPRRPGGAAVQCLDEDPTEGVTSQQAKAAGAVSNTAPSSGLNVAETGWVPRDESRA